MRAALAAAGSAALPMRFSFPRAREGGPFGQRFRPAAPARSCRVGRFTTRSKPAAEGRPAFHLLVPFPRAREGGASASGFRFGGAGAELSGRSGTTRSKTAGRGWLWRVCALAFQAGEIVLLIRGRAGAKAAARGEFLVALAAGSGRRRGRRRFPVWHSRSAVAELFGNSRSQQLAGGKLSDGLALCWILPFCSLFLTFRGILTVVIG